MTGDGDEGELVVERDRFDPGEPSLDRQRAGVGGVHDALAAESAGELGVIRDVVLVREDHRPHAPSASIRSNRGRDARGESTSTFPPGRTMRYEAAP